jgi:hypothetical protein
MNSGSTWVSCVVATGSMWNHVPSLMKIRKVGGSGAVQSFLHSCAGGEGQRHLQKKHNSHNQLILLFFYILLVDVMVFSWNNVDVIDGG